MSFGTNPEDNRLIQLLTFLGEVADHLNALGIDELSKWCVGAGRAGTTKSAVLRLVRAGVELRNACAAIDDPSLARAAANRIAEVLNEEVPSQ